MWSAARWEWELAPGTDNARQPSQAAFGPLFGHVLRADEEHRGTGDPMTAATCGLLIRETSRLVAVPEWAA